MITYQFQVDMITYPCLKRDADLPNLLIKGTPCRDSLFEPETRRWL